MMNSSNSESQEGGGALLSLAIGILAVLAVAAAAALVCTVGVVVGGGLAIRNYVRAFRFSVIDSNRGLDAPQDPDALEEDLAYES